jgi:membrane protein YdbS with pleckstrin-like domain
MYEWLKSRTLRFLRVPPQPHAPAGDPASLRVFRAGHNYFRLKLAGWVITQALALAGFIFWTAILLEVENKTNAQKSAKENRAGVPASSNTVETPTVGTRKAKRAIKSAGERIGRTMVSKDAKKGTRLHPWDAFQQMFVELALLLPAGAFIVIWALKVFSFLVYVAQIPVTYVIRRLDYEMRWYMVTDRSLRLRSGVWRVAETTMSFANIQQVRVSQGPLQRLLGLADVKVKSAGGGSGGHYEHEERDMHTGIFHNVTNADEIRDLIIERLRLFREAGLGDVESAVLRVWGGKFDPESMPWHRAVSAEVIFEARELAGEARSLRELLART